MYICTHTYIDIVLFLSSIIPLSSLLSPSPFYNFYLWYDFILPRFCITVQHDPFVHLFKVHYGSTGF